MTPIADAIIALRRNLRAKYGLHADLQLVDKLLTERLEKRVTYDIEAVIGSWTPEQLADALEANHEATQVEAATDEGAGEH